MEHCTEFDYPLRVILVTTGSSNVANFLFHNQKIDLIGIFECWHSEDNCYEYASRNQISHCFYTDFPRMEKWVETQKADLMITYKVPFLLPRNIFNKPRYGTINVHPSLLPQYRGANPWFGIYYNMESKSGVTIHKIDEYEDHGDILAQASFPITLGSPLSLLQEEAEKVAINLLNQIFDSKGSIKAIPQKDESSSILSKKHFDLESLLDLSAIDGMHLWHILRGFPFLFKKICPELEGQYVIGNFLEMYRPDEVGNIFYMTDEAYLVCCNGSIQILKNQQIKKYE